MTEPPAAPLPVLVADDDPITGRLLWSHLTRWGYAVTTVADGEQAWEAFRAGDFPLVLSDWMMPRLDGVELVRRIRAWPGAGYVFIILLSARSAKEDLVRGMEAGADDFVSKPFDPDELRVRVRAGARLVTLERALAAQNRALKDAQAAMVQSEKLASLGQMAAGVAHEINNPVAFVANNLSVLHRDVNDAMALLDTYRAALPALHETAPDIAAEAARREAEMDLPWVRENMDRQFQASLGGLERVRDIVRNLRDFARLDEADVQEVDLRDALTSTLEIARYAAKTHDVRLETAFADVPPIACHAGKMNQVFLNLIINAIQATPPGGHVRVRTENDGAEAAVHVEDTGCGIAPDHMARIFDPFFTTKPVGQGTGLGLSVSYGIVRDHGGRIDVHSEQGQGSRFTVRLPYAPEKGNTE